MDPKKITRNLLVSVLQYFLLSVFGKLNKKVLFLTSFLARFGRGGVNYRDTHFHAYRARVPH